MAEQVAVKCILGVFNGAIAKALYNKFKHRGQRVTGAFPKGCTQTY